MGYIGDLLHQGHQLFLALAGAPQQGLHLRGKVRHGLKALVAVDG